MTVPTIHREAMFEPLLAADPSFQKRWNEFLADWSDEPNPPLYVALSSLAEHLLKRLQDGDTEDFECIESVQNRLREGVRTQTTFELWLGPESKRWWQKLDRFWEGDERALRFET